MLTALNEFVNFKHFIHVSVIVTVECKASFWKKNENMKRRDKEMGLNTFTNFFSRGNTISPTILDA